MIQPIRMGIVGLGRAGYGMHLEELRTKEDRFQIAAVCDLIEERRNHVTAMFPGCKTYETIEQLVRDENVELVDIATRSNDHFCHAKLALEAGKNVFLEKPMCETYEQAQELAALTTTPGAPKLFIRHNRRFESNFETIRGLIKNGKDGILGGIFEIHINRVGFSRRDDWQTVKEFGGGQLLNWGPHVIDQALCLIDGEYTEMFSDLKHTVAAGDCEDHVIISLKGRNGVLVNVKISGGMTLGLPDYMVYGTRGSMEITGRKIKMKYIDPEQKLQTLQANTDTPASSFGATGTFASAEVIRWVEETKDSPTEDLSIIWDYLFESLRKGTDFPIYLNESVRVMQVISAAKERCNITI